MNNLNQSDKIILSPLEVYITEYWRLPHRHHVDLYILNAWLILQFLSRTNMMTNPEKLLQNQIEAKIVKYEEYLDYQKELKVKD